jgi:hypothetical protein
MSLKRILASGTAVGAALLLLAQPAGAESVNKEIKELQAQIKKLQDEQKVQQARDAAKDAQIQQLMRQVQELQSATQHATAEAEEAIAKKPTGIANTNVKVTLGGFIEAAGIYRSRNEVSDVGSSFAKIPYKDISTSHSSEFRETARQSRFAILAQGRATDDIDLAAYFETDFLGNSVTGNSGESNSYALRPRLLYTTVDDKAIGTHLIAGQAWSLVTQFKNGMEPRQENIPLTIDAQYVVGFNWRRDPQIRLVQDIGPWLHVGISAETPQAAFGGSSAPAALGVTTTVPGLGSGGGTLNSLATYSTDVAPDIVLKVAADPGFGHYEIFGLGRAFRDQSVTSATISKTGTVTVTDAAPKDHTELGGGIGANALVPVVPHYLDLQGSVLAGRGIAQYGSGQLTDVVVTPTGGLKPVNEVEALVGAIGHVTPALDTYLYAGLEREQATGVETFGTTLFGLGNPNLGLAGCFTNVAGVAFGTTTGATGCAAQTKALYELTAGLWDKVWDGPFGSFRLGLQYEFVLLQAFPGMNGKFPTSGPLANDNIVMTSIRYYPF